MRRRPTPPLLQKEPKVTWRLHLPGVSNPPVAEDAGTDFAASCQQEEEQEDDFVAMDPGREDSYLVQELREASAHAAECGVMDDGALVQSWVDGLVSRLTSAIHSVVAASNYSAGAFDPGGISSELRQTV